MRHLASRRRPVVAPSRRSGTRRRILPVLADEVGDPYFLGGPLARPLGAGQCVVGMIGSMWRSVELVQSVDEEAAAAQDLDPFAVAGVELDTALRRRQAVCLALRVTEFAAGGPVRSRGAHGDQQVSGVEHKPPAGSQQPGGLGYPAGRVAPQVGTAFGDSQVEA